MWGKRVIGMLLWGHNEKVVKPYFYDMIIMKELQIFCQSLS